MKWLAVAVLVVCIVLLSGCTTYVPVPCPKAPEVEKPEYAPIDTQAPVSEQIRQIVDRFIQCTEYNRNLETVIEEYK